MSTSAGKLDSLLGGGHGKVRRKSNNTGTLLTTAKRVTNKSAKGVQAQPEVVVKVTGFGKGGGHAKAHLTYITRHGKLELENDRGEIIQGAAAVKEMAGEWSEGFGDTKGRKAKRDTIHIILSMAPGTEPEIVKSSVRAFAKETFGKNHEYAFVLHTDQQHPHCHLTVKYRGFDGKTVKSEKSDLQQWRETFALELVKRGVEASATPRVARGVVRKSEAQVLRHIVADLPERPARVSYVRTAWIRQAEGELIADNRMGVAGTGSTPREQTPWEKKITTTRKSVEAAWLQTASELESIRTIAYKNNTAAKNERPNYDGITIGRARELRRAAFVYQSDIARNGRTRPPEPIAGLRNVSRRAVVWDRNNPEMLLHPDALHRVGEERASNSEMRRAGVGVRGFKAADRAGDVESSGRLVPGETITAAYIGSVEDSRALAKNIRAHVAALPPLETRHQLRKGMLLEGSRIEAQKANVVAAPTNEPKVTQNREMGRNASNEKSQER
jgi:type IV secretory pathway VirD2 relaxase